MASYPGVPVTVVSGSIGTISNGGGSITVNADGSVSVVALAGGFLVNGNPIAQVVSVQYDNAHVLAANSGTQTHNLTYTIPANTLTTGVALRVTAGLTLQATATIPTVAYAMTIGGVTVYSQTANTPAAISPARGWGMILMIMGTAAPGASVPVDTEINFAQPWQGALAGFTNAMNNTAQPVNLATNGTLAIAFTVTTSNSNAGNNYALRQLIVELLP